MSPGKPTHSYIGLIAMAILSRPDRRMMLSEVYDWILVNYPYFRWRGSGWRNSVRHNLSLNDCFVKAGRSANGKGHYWTIHPANTDDFLKGDFRRKQAQWKVKSHDARVCAAGYAAAASKTAVAQHEPTLGGPRGSDTAGRRRFDIEFLLKPDEAPRSSAAQLFTLSSGLIPIPLQQNS
ncbi:forkhead domain-containing protein [Aphelenchoides avenae]|nr:forkhead domain-containing protein [Aphelenchus avenae]